MRKALVLLLAILLLLPGCNNNSRKTAKKNEMVKDAVEVLEDFWREECLISSENNGYFEIKNTRVIYLKDTDIQEFENVSCIVDFVLYTDYYETHPYYMDIGAWNTVLVYQDGTMEVTHNPVLKYRSRTYSGDMTDIVDRVVDYRDQYNCVKDLRDD